MKRVYKNIIMVSIILIALIVTFFTIKDASARRNVNYSENMQKRPNTFDNIENPPEKPDDNINYNENMPNDFNNMIPPGNPNESPPNEFIPNEGTFSQKRQEILIDYPIDNNIAIKYYCFFAIEGLTISSLLMYLILSEFNKKTFKQTLKNTDKIIIYILSTILLTGIYTYISSLIVREYKNSILFEEETEKDSKKEDIDEGNKISEKDVELSKYSSNITITEGGEYNLTGKFNYSVLVNSEDDVTLNLKNVIIESSLTAAIANIGRGNLIINLENGTENKLSDGGSSEYDACLYSSSHLTIKGNGTLYIYGNQEEGEGIATETSDITINGGNIIIEANDDGLNAGGDGGTITINEGTIFIKANGDGIDSNKNLIINGGTLYTLGSSMGGDAGIDTDGGFAINGGTVIALGSDMLEKPLASSTQKSISLTLNRVIQSGDLVTLMNSNNEVIVSFVAKESFKTLIISSNNLQSGTYYLYKGGKNSGILVNNIYYNGTYSTGEIITINGNDEIKL